MNVTAIFSDADLVAFVDGRLPAEKIRAITAAAKTDTALAGRIGELAAGTPDFSALWGDMLACAPDSLISPPQPQVGAAVNRRAWLAGFGGTALGLMAGFGGWKLSNSGSQTPIDWETAVADYHVLYGPSTVRALNPTAAARMAELASVSSASGLALPALDVSGLTYRRAQMLDLRGQPIVHIVLSTANVVPIALCLTPDRGPTRSIRYRRAADMGLVSWATGQAAFCLVARLPEGQLLSIAAALSA